MIMGAFTKKNMTGFHYPAFAPFFISTEKMIEEDNPGAKNDDYFRDSIFFLLKFFDLIPVKYSKINLVVYVLHCYSFLWPFSAFLILSFQYLISDRVFNISNIYLTQEDS